MRFGDCGSVSREQGSAKTNVRLGQWPFENLAELQASTKFHLTEDAGQSGQSSLAFRNLKKFRPRLSPGTSKGTDFEQLFWTLRLKVGLSVCPNDKVSK